MLCGYYIHPVWITSSILALLTFLKLSFCLCEPQLNQGLNGYLLESKILLLQTMVLKCCLYLLTICIIKCSMGKQVDFEKMPRHRIQWLLACNLLSNFVCTFKNVAEGYIHAKNANMGGAVQSL